MMHIVLKISGFRNRPRGRIKCPGRQLTPWKNRLMVLGNFNSTTESSLGRSQARVGAYKMEKTVAWQSFRGTDHATSLEQ